MTETPATFPTAFKQTTNGWVFAPTVATMGPWFGTRFGAQYLVNDAQKAELDGKLKSMLFGVKVAFFFGLMVAMFARHPSWPFTLLKGIAIFLVPFVGVLGWYGVAMRRITAGTQRTSDRITYAEAIAADAAAMPMSKLVFELGANILGSGLLMWAGYHLWGDKFYNSLGAMTLWGLGFALFCGLTFHSSMKLKRALDAQARSSS
jgi:hypothetical protein